MTTTGTTTYNPAFGEIVLMAFQQCGLRPASLLQEHLESARMAANLMAVSWMNQGVSLWKVDLQTVTLIAGQHTYDVPGDTVMMLDAYVSTTSSGQTINRIMLPISRSEWASYPFPEQQGFSTVFWFNRLIAPTVTIWPVPDGSSEQTFSYYRVAQTDDMGLQSGATMDIPWRYLDAANDDLTARLARIWVPEKAMALQAMADKSYKIATLQDEETSQVYIIPGVSGYFRP